MMPESVLIRSSSKNTCLQPQTYRTTEVRRDRVGHLTYPANLRGGDIHSDEKYI